MRSKYCEVALKNGNTLIVDQIVRADWCDSELLCCKVLRIEKDNGGFAEFKIGEIAGVIFHDPLE